MIIGICAALPVIVYPFGFHEVNPFCMMPMYGMHTAPGGGGMSIAPRVSAGNDTHNIISSSPPFTSIEGKGAGG